MRKAPPVRPNKLPDIAATAKKIQKIVDRPSNRLGDISIGQLAEMLSDGTPAWLTGSTVWLPAVFDQDPDRDGDYDVVFSSRASAELFVRGALTELNRRAPKGQEFKAVTNALGGSRILHPDGEGVIDAWYVEEGESIHELLMAYPRHTGDHIRCAYHLTRSPSAASLIRIVKTPDERIAQKEESLFARIGKAKVTSYYGA